MPSRTAPQPAPELSVVVTVTTGGQHVERCLEALLAQVAPIAPIAEPDDPQADGPAVEILVPVDASVAGVAGWAARFPTVRFPEVPGEAPRAEDPGSAHLAYDRRRATGLAAARAPILALTEDHARPAPDWCRRILAAHRRLPHAAIGGAIDNASPQTLTWAVYFSDFGRYQSPLPEGPADYVSDVNVSYKRAALLEVAETWRGTYHETAVHGALKARGGILWRAPEIIVQQARGKLALGPVLRERFAWGRLYAGKRAHEVPAAKRWLLALGAPLLPPLLLARQLRNTLARGRNVGPFLRALPALVLLVCCWSAGEAVGLWTGAASRGRS